MIPASAVSSLQHSLSNRFLVCRGTLDERRVRPPHFLDSSGAHVEACTTLVKEMSSVPAELGGGPATKTQAAEVLHRLSGYIGLARAHVRQLINLQEIEEARRFLREIDVQLASAGGVVIDFQAEWLDGATHTLREAITRAATNTPDVEFSLSDHPAFDELVANRFVREFLDEALINARKHGRPNITLEAIYVNGEIVIRVGDHGPGFAPDDITRGHGMRILENSAAALGGALIIRSSPCTVTLRFPVE
jgi:signal transduction histidine kinase